MILPGTANFIGVIGTTFDALLTLYVKLSQMNIPGNANIIDNGKEERSISLSSILPTVGISVRNSTEGVVRFIGPVNKIGYITTVN